MKRAQTQVVRASFLQLYEGSDDLDDIDPVVDLLYGMRADQGQAGILFEPSKVPTISHAGKGKANDRTRG